MSNELQNYVARAGDLWMTRARQHGHPPQAAKQAVKKKPALSTMRPSFCAVIFDTTHQQESHFFDLFDSARAPIWTAESSLLEASCRGHVVFESA